MDLLSAEGVIAGIGIVIGVVSIVLVMVVWSKLKKMKASYDAMMNGSGVHNLADVIAQIQARINALQAAGKEADVAIAAIRERLAIMKGNAAIYRYNAFNDMGKGSDLSFSLAILDDAMNGVVFTAIHGREETYVYGKPITAGESSYALSPEEKQAIQQAMNMNS